jgi:hypothetical protein
MLAFWTTHALTGDNVRERPYGDIYPRLTTKSNTFTVHYRVQMLKKIPTTAAGQWVEGSDVVTAEYRGSSTLERYLDLSNTSIPDYATQPQPLPAGKAIDDFYKFRVVETNNSTRDPVAPGSIPQQFHASRDAGGPCHHQYPHRPVPACHHEHGPELGLVDGRCQRGERA